MGEAKTKAAPKLSVKKPGYWRNKWFMTGQCARPRSPKTIFTSDKTYIGSNVWPTAEIAEAKALEDLARREKFRRATNIYLGPVFFPDP